MSSENVYDICQIGDQGGTMAAPGAAAAATFVLPIDSATVADLDRAGTYPAQDRGRNVRNAASSGFFGIRGSGTTLPFLAAFEDLQDILEMQWSVVSPSAPSGGYYTRVYPLEAGVATVHPKTIQLGNTDTSVAQQRLVSCLVDSLTLGFPDIVGTGAYPWAASATIIGLDREISALTAAQSVKTGREVIQGHLSRLYEGTTGTAFAALAELGSALKSFTATFTRNYARRAYGSASDVATAFGFKDKTNATGTAKIAISTTAKTDFHDIWNVASPASLGERRWRVKTIGNGSKEFDLDMRVGLMAVPYDEADGERLFACNFEIVDDSTLGAPAQITLVNQIA